MYISSRVRKRITLTALCIVALVVGTCVMQPVYAEEPPKPPTRVKLEIIPKGRMIDVDHQLYRAFTAEEFVELIKLDRELVDLRKDIKDYEKIDLAYAEARKSKDAQIKLLEDDMGVIQANWEATNKLLYETINRANEAEAAESFAWKVAAGALTVSVGVLLGVWAAAGW